MKLKTFKEYVKEEAPANNAMATPGIEGFTPESVPVKSKHRIIKRKKITSRNRDTNEFI